MLIDGLDAELAGDPWVETFHASVAQADVSAIRRINPAQDLDQSALPGAIVSNQCCHFARVKIKGNRVEGLDAAEILCDFDTANDRTWVHGIHDTGVLSCSSLYRITAGSA